jgi:anti-sigma factor ChrR (cupin superfamily)
MTPDPVPPFDRIEILNLFQIAQWSEKIPWQPFQEGIDIHRLHGDGKTGSSSALIRFRKAGKVPLHRHPGREFILVLAGSQTDQNSTIRAGTLAINPPATSHSVVGEAGCIVLAIYEQPVEFIAGPPVAGESL